MPSYDESLVRAANDLNSGRLEEAGKRLDRLIRDYPKESPPYNLRAILRKAEGDMDGALADTGAALEIEPDNVQYRVNLGTVMLLQGDHHSALENFARAVEQKPDHTLARRNRGMLLLALERFAEALDDLRLAVDGEPRRGETRIALADALVEAGALNDALAELKEAEKLLGEQTPQWQHVWGRMVYRSGRLPAAREAFMAALLAQPNEIRHHIALAATHFHEGDVRQAREITRAALKRFPTTERRAGTPELAVLVLEAFRQECFHELSDRTFNHTGGNFISYIAPGRVSYTHAITDYIESPGDLPNRDSYDVVYNNHAVHETTVRHDQVEPLSRLIAGLDLPVVNRPEAVAGTTRTANAEKFADAREFVFPRTIRVRHELDPAVAHARILDALTLPIILRPPETHKGVGARLVETEQQLFETIARQPYAELYAIEYHDCQSEDGLYRRYRLACVDGDLSANSMHVASDWNVHGAQRETIGWFERGFDREEAAFYDAPERLLNGDPKTRFREIVDKTDLDIFGFDFGFRKDGRIIVFEVNAGMELGFDVDFSRYQYRKPNADRLRGKIEELLISRSRGARPAAS